MLFHHRNGAVGGAVILSCLFRRAGYTRPPQVYSSNLANDVEHRQIHSDQNTADYGAHKHDDDRLDN